MIGILCEKPSAARNFAAALGGASGTFEGEKYVITNALGHLYEFKKPDAQVSQDKASRYKSWDLMYLPWDERDFKWEYDVRSKDVSAQIAKVRSVLSGCDEIAIATDVDPSGEGFLLAAEVLLELKLRPKKWTRVYFTDESKKEIVKAMKSRKQVPSLEKDPEYLMGFYRSRWDLLSMQWTRIATKVSGANAPVRQGRLKSAMVVIVGDALKALEAYKPIPFFQNRFKDENGVVYTDPKEPTYPDKLKVPQMFSSSPVVVDKTEMKHTAPPKLLDLATLSARLAGKGLKSKQVLDTYQKMYEAQIVSYPRTEDKFISPEQFNDLLPHIDAIAALVGVDKALLTNRQPRSTHVKSGGAHGANRPGLNVPKSLDALGSYGPGAKEIYVLLAQNYLAMLAEDYVYESQKGHVEKYPSFVGTAQVPKSMGWKQVFDEDAAVPDDENAKGIGTQAQPFIFEGVNPKPPTPTMKWLMAQLEKHNVGTGATRTSTYTEVTSDKIGLLVDKRGKITMGPIGEISYKLLPGTHIGSLELTEKVWADMKKVAAGQMNPDEGLYEIQKMVKEDIKTMSDNASGLDAPVKKERYAGNWNGRDISFSRVFGGYRFSDAECEVLCKGGEVHIMGLQGKNGTYNVRGRLEEQPLPNDPSKHFVGFKTIAFLNDDGSDKTPAGGAPGPEYATGKFKGKDIKFMRKWSGHEFTEKEIEDLLAGLEITFETTFKSGKTGPVTGKLALQTYNGAKFYGFKPDFGNK